MPPLVGTEFISAWQGQTLNDLAGKLMTMPPDTSEKMSAQDYVDIMTLLLLMNAAARKRLTAFSSFCGRARQESLICWADRPNGCERKGQGGGYA